MIIKIDLSQFDYTTHIEQYDSATGADAPYWQSGDENYNTIGFTLKDVPKGHPLVKEIQVHRKDHKDQDNQADFNWISNNMRFIGRGYIYTAKWKRSLNTANTSFIGTFKVSFRAYDYMTIKGQAMIRDYTLSQILG